MNAPSTLGEWDIEIAARDSADLVRYREALEALKGWEAFDSAFRWTRIFTLHQSIGFELDRREAKR